MSLTTDSGAEALELTRSEQWVLHDIMLRELEAAEESGRSPPWWALGVLKQVEEDALTLTCFEAWRVKRTVQSYVDEAPDRDQSPARSILDRIGAAYRSPPATVRQRYRRIDPLTDDYSRGSGGPRARRLRGLSSR
jgi:hypothetical protein